MKRREFVGMGMAALAGVALAGKEEAKVLWGACRGLGDAKLMKELGYDFLENGVAPMLQPDKSDAQWKKQRDAILGAAIPLRSCNGFLPGKFRLTGEKASFDGPLAYATKACERADQVGLKVIVFGSGSTRKVPDGFSHEKAMEQFVDFCAKLAKRIEGCKVQVVLEPLRPKECNFLNFVREGIEVCKKVCSPRICQLADIYHMMEGGEGAESIVKAGALLKHCHIAEKGPRTAPGLKSDGSQFLPYFKALKQIGYTGGVSCECGWGDGKKLKENLAKAIATMKGVWAKA